LDVVVEGRTLSVSNLDKVLYPAVHFTKAEVLDYYARIAPVLLPHLGDRAVTLRRFPNGPAGKSFYEKNCPRSTAKAGGTSSGTARGGRAQTKRKTSTTKAKASTPTRRSA